MGRPSGVSHTNWSRKVVKIIFCVDFLESSAVLLYSQPVIVDGYLADRVIASVLKPLECRMNDWGRMRAIVKDAAEYSTQTPNILPVDFAMVGDNRALRIATRLTPDSCEEVALQPGFSKFFPDSSSS